jgi:hypothetical protein
MALYIWLVFVYEVFGNLLTEFARQGMAAPADDLSALERRLWKDTTALSFFAVSFPLIARINSIAFLIYLGFQTVWWHPIILWVGCLLATAVVASLFRGATGLTIPALLSFVVLPVTGVSLWLIV